jgi:hypothetical protein
LQITFIAMIYLLVLAGLAGIVYSVHSLNGHVEIDRAAQLLANKPISAPDADDTRQSFGSIGIVVGAWLSLIAIGIAGCFALGHRRLDANEETLLGIWMLVFITALCSLMLTIGQNTTMIRDTQQQVLSLDKVRLLTGKQVTVSAHKSHHVAEALANIAAKFNLHDGDCRQAAEPAFVDLDSVVLEVCRHGTKFTFQTPRSTAKS